MSVASEIPGWLQVVLSIAGGGGAMKLLDIYIFKARGEQKNTDRLWQTIGGMQAEIQSLRGEIAQVRHERNEAIESMTVLKLQNYGLITEKNNLRGEVDHLLIDSGKPAKYGVAKP
jgi:hypothetical protein